MKLDLLVASGGVLSHAPRMEQTALMLVDSFEPEGFTELAKDSIFMMPHLGVLSTVNEKAATDVFINDCLVYLGTCVAPIGQGKDGEKCADYEIVFKGGRAPEQGSLSFGELKLIALGDNERATITMKPGKSVDLGEGKGVAVTKEARGGAVGILLDGRGRPLQLPADATARVNALNRWNQAVNLYPVKG